MTAITEIIKIVKKELKLIIGLGNKGKEYANTRHNLGYKVVEKLAEKYNQKFTINRLNAKLTPIINVGGESVVIVKPNTFVNLSGIVVNNLLNFYELTNESLIIICDDINLPVGKIRIRKKGSAGGHNGLKSIIENIGTTEFVRIRVGISKPEDSNYDLAKYVLEEFKPDELPKIEEMINLTIEAIEVIIERGVDKAMNKFN